MAALTKKIRGWFQGPPHAFGLRAKHAAARHQLNEHLDEELLDGFIRRKLTREQHTAVLSHLGNCKDCQEAVAVILLAEHNPAAAAEIVLKQESRAKERGPWWRIALSWTGIVFGVFAIAFMLYVLPGSEKPGSTLGEIFRTAPPSQNSSSRNSDTAFGEWLASTMSSKTPAGNVAASHRHEPGRTASKGDTAPPPPRAKVRETPVRMEVEIPPDKPAKLDQSRPAEQHSLFKLDQIKPDKRENNKSVAIEPATTGVVPFTPQHRSVVRQEPSSRRLVVTDEGELLRTLDGGKTWKVITIRPGLAFNSLAVSGGTIWAVGDGGALFRSPDAAEHWQQVTLKYIGVPLTADLAEIRFEDAQHGMLKTFDGEIWITVDGGNKWILSFRPSAGQ